MSSHCSLLLVWGCVTQLVSEQCYCLKQNLYLYPNEFLELITVTIGGFDNL